MTDGFNYLVVSDLHLRGGFHNPTEGLYHFDEEFADFLRYYRVHHASTHPWRLVIGGDLVEFLYITDVPSTDEPLLRGATFRASEYRYGAGSDAQKSRWKLDIILRSSHPQLLLALARFVAEGNEIIILRGNHDIELFWPEAQDHFRRLIAEHHPADVSYMQMKAAVAERVQFPQWFWYTPGLLYVEHGSQYDPFCATQHMLCPVVPGNPRSVQHSIAELSIRYFTNQVKLINALASENIMSVSEYLGWLLRSNWRLVPRLVRLYGAMVRRILAKSGRPDPQAERVVREEHERRMAAVDERFGLAPGTAAAVDAMHATPVMRRRLATASFLALDLVAIGALLAVATTVILIWYPARVGLLAFVAAAVALGLIAYLGSLRVRGLTGAARLRQTAERLAQLFKVRYVLLGHSHRAGIWPLSNGSTYVNVGTWVPAGGEAYFVYFSVEHDGAQQDSRLWRWNRQKRVPEPFQP